MAETKTAQCINIVKFNPDLTDKQKLEIATQIGCSKRTVDRAVAEVRKANNLAQVQKVSSKAKKKKKASKRKRQPSKKTKGKRGRKSGNPKNIKTPKTFQKPPPNKIPKISKNEPFEHFCKTHSFPYYKGLYRWQYDWFDHVWKWKYSLTLVARDHGKSIGHGNLCQWAMSAKGYDILYLGWTNRRREIAQFVYNFFLIRKELIIDKASSPYHFRTIYGTKFDTYSVKSKEILGMHEMGDLERQITDENRYLEDFIRNDERPLLMIIDDAIDNTFRKERHKEKDLEDFFRSTISSINPDKMMTVGTHKFEGDFYFFLQDVIGEDLYVYKQGPFLKEDDLRYGKEPDNPTNLLCPERWIDGDHPDYDLYLDLLELIKLGGEEEKKYFSDYDLQLIKKKDLKKKRQQVGEYWWFSDYEQNPHPITGEVWDKVHYIPGLGTITNYDLICLTIDRATTQNKKSDYTGIVEIFREKTGPYVVTNDYTQKIRQTDLILLIDKLYLYHMKNYAKHVRLIIVVEKQGGGDDFCDLATDLGKRWAHLIIRIHSTRNKEDRIEDNLGTPIQNAGVVFLTALKTSELVEKEILVFPYMAKVDALDALSNGVFEMEKIPRKTTNANDLAKRLQSFHKNQNQSKNLQELLSNYESRQRSVFQ